VGSSFHSPEPADTVAPERTRAGAAPLGVGVLLSSPFAFGGARRRVTSGASMGTFRVSSTTSLAALSHHLEQLVLVLLLVER
jgi:hypothetical protein